MFLYSMPFLVLNLGGEMVYILKQRLKAQQISKVKSKKVLEEVTANMLNEKLIAELSKPQPIYSPVSTKEIFDKLAHSSIMKLSSNSMSKLFDLMCMGLKYQILMTYNPKEIVQLTYTHLDVMKAILPTSKHVIGMREKLNEIISNMTEQDFFSLKEELLGYFKDKNVKVGVFLSKGFQTRSKGFFVLDRDQTEFFHTHKNPLGTIETYDAFGKVVSKFQIPHPWKNVSCLNVDYLSTEQRTSPLGKTLYIKDQDSGADKKKKAVAAKKKKKKSFKPEKKEKPKTTTGEFNYLASLLGGVTEQSAENEDSFDLDIFADDFDVGDSEEEGESDEEEQSQRRDHVIFVNSNQNTENLAKDFELEGKKNIVEEEDDLLSLMDGL